MTEIFDQPIYVIASSTPPPADYPFEPTPDSFSISPFLPDYEARRQAFLDFVLHNPAPTHTKAPYFELARLAAGGTPHLGVISAALDYIDERRDCADFVIHSILRLLYQFSDHPSLPPELLERARQTVLGFKYWPDEPGIDSMCYWTENHYVLFSAAAYLAGQLYPQETFANSGYTGAELQAAHRPRLLRWMELRYFTGFSEWLSNVYYDEDLTALVSLVDFCQDGDIRQRATIITDLLLLDISLNSYNGIFGSTHGRSYEHSKKYAGQEATTDTTKLLFGQGIFSNYDNMSAVAFALSSRYHLPPVIYAIANDQGRPEMLNRQRMGIDVAEAQWWSLNPRDIEDALHLLTLEAYLHPRTANTFMRMLKAFNWWENDFFRPFKERRFLLKTLRAFGLLPLVARLFESDLCRNTRESVDIYTYRTPDYMLSSAQDYRKGSGGDQQHIWQATLGPDAVCFTTHPPRSAGPPPNYWAGSGSLPRVGQVKNVLFAVYYISRAPALYIPNQLIYTHAWLPRNHFTEIEERDGWIFARLGDGYLALTSQQPYEWQSRPGQDQFNEIIAHGRRNIWVCELGRKAVDGEFRTFIERILEAELRYKGSRVYYQSPSQGVLEFGWQGPLLQDGRPLPLGDYPRYGNPYVQAEFPTDRIEIRLDEHFLNLDWVTAAREY
jgi:hypothetical protein